LRFRQNPSAVDFEQTVDRLKGTIRKHSGKVKHIFIESDSVSADRKEKWHEYSASYPYCHVIPTGEDFSVHIFAQHYTSPAYPSSGAGMSIAQTVL
jgi:hypothetical protein